MTGVRSWQGHRVWGPHRPCRSQSENPGIRAGTGSGGVEGVSTETVLGVERMKGSAFEGEPVAFQLEREGIG